VDHSRRLFPIASPAHPAPGALFLCPSAERSDSHRRELICQKELSQPPSRSWSQPNRSWSRRSDQVASISRYKIHHTKTRSHEEIGTSLLKITICIRSKYPQKKPQAPDVRQKWKRSVLQWSTETGENAAWNDSELDCDLSDLEVITRKQRLRGEHLNKRVDSAIVKHNV
jgi:hypothetical protein